MNSVWNIKEYDKNIVQEYCNYGSVSPILAKLLIARGIEKEKVREYISPSLNDLYDPFLMKDMNKVTDRILLAKQNKEKVMIYGDYDVDGVTSITILYSFLKEIGMDVAYYLPDRMEEGYGLNKIALDDIKSRGFSLVITVDCGISAVDEIEYARNIGLEVCITDHHECSEKFPKAYAIVNPKQETCEYPYKMLAGVGVSFKVITALAKKLNMEDYTYLKYIDIVSVGTIADIVPLCDENRIFTKFGLEKIKDTRNEGLRAIIKVAGIKNIDSTSISFGVAPRINASGRMADATVAVKLLLSKNEVEAFSYAKLLDSQNKERQSVEKDILQQVIFKIEKEKLYEKDSIVVSGNGWHQGVIGIVASKVAEKYLKPVVLITYENEVAKGSGRTPVGISLYDALEMSKDELVQFGGHELAAGITIKTNNIDKFTEKFEESVKILKNKEFESIINIDLEINKKDIIDGLINEAKKLLPFGQKNPEPIYIYKGIKVVSLSTLKDGKHLKVNLSDNDFVIDGIGFGLGNRRDEIKLGDRIDVVGSISENEFNGKIKPQIIIKDFKKVVEG